MSSATTAAGLSGKIVPQDAEGGVFARDASAEAIQEAWRWAGKTMTVSGVGGFVCVNSMNDFVVSTSFRQATATALVIEPADKALYGRGLVAFRVRDAHNKYLAVSPYVDDIRNEAAAALARVTLLLPEHISDIANFAADEATSEGNFEGAGFNYRPQTDPRRGYRCSNWSRTSLGGMGSGAGSDLTGGRSIGTRLCLRPHIAAGMSIGNSQK